MSDLLSTIIVILLVLGLVGAVLLVEILLGPYRRLKMVWCPGIDGVSFVETEPTSIPGATSPSVKNCLLWPRLHGCEQRCLARANEIPTHLH
jgi:hypothetical protein